MIEHYRGAYRTVVFAPDENGRHRGKDYFEDQRAADRAKLQALIERHCEDRFGLRNKEKFRAEGKHVWVFKSFQHRLYCYCEGDTVYITHGFRKKTDRALEAQLKITRRLREFNMPTEGTKR